MSCRCLMGPLEPSARFAARRRRTFGATDRLLRTVSVLVSARARSRAGHSNTKMRGGNLMRTFRRQIMTLTIALCAGLGASVAAEAQEFKQVQLNEKQVQSFI